jgi:hypothetical protein
MPRNRPINRISDAGVQNLPTLFDLAKATLPPEGADLLHKRLVAGLGIEVSLDPNASNQTTLAEATKDACQAYTKIKKDISARTYEAQTTDSHYFAFRPPNSPVQLEVDTLAGFAVTSSKSFSIPTLYGAFTVGYRSAPGIHNLVVRFRDKQRYFALDRAFEFYLPPGFAIKVSYAGTDELLIAVEGP